MDYYLKVKEFTQATSPSVIPSKPQKMTAAQLVLLTSLVIEELIELITASTGDAVHAQTLIMYAMSRAGEKSIELPKDEDEQIAAEQDALVDLVYVTMNGAAKTGVDFDAVFNLVHDANMKKVNPATGKVLRRQDGKVVKPEGWTPPDIISEIKRQRGE